MFCVGAGFLGVQRNVSTIRFFMSSSTSHRPKRAVRTGPLRRVLERVPPVGHELLECGHTQSPLTDIYGEVYAFRRRCRKCKENKPQDVTPETLAKALKDNPPPPEPTFTCSKCGSKAYSLDYKVHPSGLCGSCRSYIRLKERFANLNADNSHTGYQFLKNKT